MPIEGSRSGLRFAPVILAGGSGTRFWPRSRKARAEAGAGAGWRPHDDSADGGPAAAAWPMLSDVWVITNDLLDELIAEQLPRVAARADSERACGAEYGSGVCAGGVSAGADRAGDGDRDLSFGPRGEECGAVCRGDSRGCEAGGQRGEDRRAGRAADARGDGYGYIEQGAVVDSAAVRVEVPVRRVKRFTREAEAGRWRRSLWRPGTMRGTAGCFCGARGRWRMRSGSTVRRWLRCWRRLRRRMGRRSLRLVFAEVYPQCENI